MDVDELAARLGRSADDLEVRVFAGALVGAVIAAAVPALQDPEVDFVALVDRTLEFLEKGMPLQLRRQRENGRSAPAEARRPSSETVDKAAAMRVPSGGRANRPRIQRLPRSLLSTVLGETDVSPEAA